MRTMREVYYYILMSLSIGICIYGIANTKALIIVEPLPKLNVNCNVNKALCICTKEDEGNIKCLVIN